MKTPRRLIAKHLPSRLRANGGGGIRGIACEFGCSPNVVLNRIARLARGAIGVHSDLRSLFALDEDLVADGFEGFVASQYWPVHFTILVGSESQYLTASTTRSFAVRDA